MNVSQELLRIQPIKWPLGLAADVLLSVFPVSYQAFQKASHYLDSRFEARLYSR